MIANVRNINANIRIKTGIKLNGSCIKPMLDIIKLNQKSYTWCIVMSRYLQQFHHNNGKELPSEKQL